MDPTNAIRSKPQRLIQLAPALPDVPNEPASKTFLDLPAELRNQIYALALENVIIHILPLHSTERFYSHPLTRTSRQIRTEVFPLMHALCPIRSVVTDFNFEGLLAWQSRIPPLAQGNLTKNQSLSIKMCTTHTPPGNLESMRRWLHDRADTCRPQPSWTYHGPQPNGKVANDLRRRIKRMKEEGKQAELRKIARAIGVLVEGPCGVSEVYENG